MILVSGLELRMQSVTYSEHTVLMQEEGTIFYSIPMSKK